MTQRWPTRQSFDRRLRFIEPDHDTVVLVRGCGDGGRRPGSRPDHLDDDDAPATAGIWRAQVGQRRGVLDLRSCLGGGPTGFGSHLSKTRHSVRPRPAELSHVKRRLTSRIRTFNVSRSHLVSVDVMAGTHSCSEGHDSGGAVTKRPSASTTSASSTVPSFCSNAALASLCQPFNVHGRDGSSTWFD